MSELRLCRRGDKRIMAEKLPEQLNLGEYYPKAFTDPPAYAVIPEIIFVQLDHDKALPIDLSKEIVRRYNRYPKLVEERRELLRFLISLEKALSRDCYTTFAGVPKPLKKLLDKICGPKKKVGK